MQNRSKNEESFGIGALDSRWPLRDTQNRDLAVMDSANRFGTERHSNTTEPKLEVTTSPASPTDEQGPPHVLNGWVLGPQSHSCTIEKLEFADVEWLVVANHAKS